LQQLDELLNALHDLALVANGATEVRGTGH
jgi:hypothetical protein